MRQILCYFQSLFICLSIHLFIYLFAYLFVRLFSFIIYSNLFNAELIYCTVNAAMPI